MNTMSSEEDSISNITLVASGTENDSYITDNDNETSENETVDLAAARQWQEIDLHNVPPSPPPFPFTETPKLVLNFDSKSEILQYFENYFDCEFIDKICVETNIYAEEYIQTQQNVKPFPELMCNKLKVFWPCDLTRHNKKDHFFYKICLIGISSK